jgi:hypothetical protein
MQATASSVRHQPRNAEEKSAHKTLLLQEK